jgi:hypothetical protein
MKDFSDHENETAARTLEPNAHETNVCDEVLGHLYKGFIGFIELDSIESEPVRLELLLLLAMGQ